jgi:hypothetical protein
MLNAGADFSIGSVFTQGGRPKDALPYLRSVTRSCFQLDNPLVFGLALLFEGRALEALGDLAGARVAYERLLQLWGKAKGSFRTTATYSSATIRGTTWGIQDRCDGSLTTALDDPVDVADFVLNKTVTITGGQTYLARPGALTPPTAKVPTIAGHQTAKTVKAHGLRVGGTAYTTRAKLTAYLTKTGSSWAAFATKYPALAKALAARKK